MKDIKYEVSMIRIRKINMHRSVFAHELLAQFAEDVKNDLVLISKRYRNKAWLLDLLGTAVTWVRGTISLWVHAQAP